MEHEAHGFAVAAALVMAVMLVPEALAQEAVADENCTFKNSKTTCTESVYLYHYWVSTDYGHVHLGNDVWVPLCSDNYVDVFETTTTAYKGKSDKVLSTETTITESEPYIFNQYYC